VGFLPDLSVRPSSTPPFWKPLAIPTWVIRNGLNKRCAGRRHELCHLPRYRQRQRRAQRGLVAAKATRQLRRFDDLLRRCPLGEATNAVFEAAVNIHADLKSKGRICNDMDILIAAFCQTYDLTLVTNNTRHFKNIASLTLVDWSIA
jgi:predicted nucleic acid-binding protein